MDDDAQAYEDARARAREIRDFYSHLAVYVAVNIGLFIIDVLSGGGTWFYWPLVGWGIGLAVHAAWVFGPWRAMGEDWEERKAREILERRRRGRE